MLSTIETADIITVAREALFEQVSPSVARLTHDWGLMRAEWLDDAHDALSAEGHMTREAQARGAEYPADAIKAVQFARALRKIDAAHAVLMDAIDDELNAE